MHERKQMMADLADAFVALPGGIGPWRNCSRSGPGFTWAIIRSPARSSTSPALYDPLIAFWTGMVVEGFLKTGTREMLLTGVDPDALLERLRDYRAPATLPILARDEL
jgi:predicted Rossmann-fold nucleotide-binding protein